MTRYIRFCCWLGLAVVAGVLSLLLALKRPDEITVASVSPPDRRVLNEVEIQGQTVRRESEEPQSSNPIETAVDEALPFEEEIRKRRVSSGDFNGADIEEVLSWLAGEVGKLKSAQPQIELEGREARDFPKMAGNLDGLTIEVVIKHLSVVWDLNYQISEHTILFTEKDLAVATGK